MGTLIGDTAWTPFNIFRQLNLNHFIDYLDQGSVKPTVSSSQSHEADGPVYTGIPRADSAQLPSRKPSGLWDRSWQPIAFISEASIMVTSLAMATTETIAFQRGNGIQKRTGHLTAWTLAGTTGGAALGNLSCALLDVNNDYAQCDLIGGLLGSLAAFFLADHLVPQNIPGIRRSGPQMIQVQMPPIFVPTHPVKPPLEDHYQWPRDEYGP